MVELMTEVVERVSAFRTGYLAILELRLEATRRPELQALLTDRVRDDLDFNIGNYRESGLPGGEDAVVLLYLALNWLILDRLTLPRALRREARRRSGAGRCRPRNPPVMPEV